MNIRSSAQTVMCGTLLKKQGKAVKLNVQERWNPLFIQNFFVRMLLDVSSWS